MALIFFDIDGTLWDKENVIPESTKDALKKLKERGHQIFLCSGRTRVFIQNEELLGMDFDGIISGCGTHIQYRGEDLFYKKLEDELLERSVRLFYEYDLPMVMEGRYKLYMDPEIISQDPYGRYLLTVMKDYTQPIRDRQQEWEASKFSVLIRNRDYPAVIEQLKEDYEFLIHGDVAMEAVPKGYSKATGIAYLCNRLGVDRKDTYAFGDSVNDLDMLEYVGIGICMGNGEEVVKARADYVTDSIHADGIFNACRHFNLI